ncbi:hypothetical protein Drorol1_Dr00025257 [Drosera rotundifolia]
MGAPNQKISLPRIDDLLVTIESSMLIFSEEKNYERKSMFLSNIDQGLNFDVQSIHFFAANPDFPPEIAFKKIENALRKLMVTYEFLAGRIKMNTDSGRMEFDCNNAGMGFVMARSERTLDELGDLVRLNPAFQSLVTKRLDCLSPGSHPLCIFQMTSFKCGGFSMGVLANHTLFDGGSTRIFSQNLAAIAGDKPLAVIPYNDRKLLAARLPPLVKFLHHERLKLNVPLAPHATTDANFNIFDNSSSDLDLKVFHLSPDDLLHLKSKANSGPSSGKHRFTSFSIVVAHIWRCKALSFEAEDNLERESTLLFAVDIRQRLNPPLPVGYNGNAVLSAYAKAKCRDIAEAPLSRLVEMVAEGTARMTDEYVRSAIDWVELNKGFPNGEFMISSWWRLGLGEVEYPWGKSVYSCPLVSRRKDIIILHPDIADRNSDGKAGSRGGGVNVSIALPHKEMIMFESLFYEHLA